MTDTKVYNGLLDPYLVEVEEQPDGSLRQVVSIGGGTGSTQLALQLDSAGSGITYIGEAAVGSATSASAWRIKRMTETGSDLVIEWADGNAGFDNVWDDRGSLSYG